MYCIAADFRNHVVQMLIFRLHLIMHRTNGLSG